MFTEQSRAVQNVLSCMQLEPLKCDNVATRSTSTRQHVLFWEREFVS
jgi:hypothetical protein